MSGDYSSTLSRCARVDVEGVSKTFRRTDGNDSRAVHVLHDISFSVVDGEIVSLFGPNGCGKTTLLNIIAGLLQADSGDIRIRTDRKRAALVGYVFQNYADSLLPWRTVLDNVAFPLELQGVSLAKRRERARLLLERLDIPIRQQAYPYQLSGGQQQLAAIARALIADPDVLVMDEPFGSLDLATRLAMEQKLQEIHSRIGCATVFVSHDIDEALLLADRFILLGPPPTAIVDCVEVRTPRPRAPEWIVGEECVHLKSRAMEVFRKVTGQ